ncbi:TOBE domain-containing protein [Bradyrhizobium sp. CB82]|uniref:TOBE domain-containing protein n=1 Tax=Bradyrhizobium sp. CB82 TaxID=3039159 RepID=UPI0024B08658|nr:TOBE domain-containing protein [Bradyrhizobium sp. CB82]WFU40014.1 TOBE domain-containing protein [Bradyrhizobium sp. CB82]
MIRPERIRIANAQENVGESDNILSGEVISISFVGGMTRVAVRTENGLAVTAKMMSERAESRLDLGVRVRLCWATSDMVVLDQ